MVDELKIRVHQYWEICHKGGYMGNDYSKTPENPKILSTGFVTGSLKWYNACTYKSDVTKIVKLLQGPDSAFRKQWTILQA